MTKSGREVLAISFLSSLDPRVLMPVAGGGGHRSVGGGGRGRRLIKEIRGDSMHLDVQ